MRPYEEYHPFGSTSWDTTAACVPQVQDASFLFESDALPLMAPTSDGVPGYGVAVKSQEPLCGLYVSPPIPE